MLEATRSHAALSASTRDLVGYPQRCVWVGDRVPAGGWTSTITASCRAECECGSASCRESLHDLFVTRDEVLAAVRGRAEALVAGDPDGLLRLLHEQFTWTSHRGEVFDRAGYVRANTEQLRWRSQVIEDPQVTIVGGTAVVVGAVRDVVERDGETSVFVMRITQTWVREFEGWLCLAGHAGPLSPHDRA